MTNDPSVSDIVLSWKKQHRKKLKKNQKEMAGKIRTEFQKISKEDLLNTAISEVIQIVFYDRPDRHLYGFESFPELREGLSAYLSAHMENFYDQAMVINEDGYNLMTYIEFILNSFDPKNLYWVSYPQIGHDIMEEADSYTFTLIRFDADLYRTLFYLNGDLHPFIKSLNMVWSAQYKESNYDSCFRKAAASMSSLANNIWDSLNILSSLKYEGHSNSGGLLFIKDYSPHLIITLKKPVPLSQHRSIRKLLQMSRKGHYLLINHENIAIGFGNIISLDPVFRVEFLDHLKWRLYQGETEYLSCTNLMPLLPNAGSDITRLKDHLNTTFPQKSCNLSRIISVIHEAQKQRHGTMVVISGNAEEEAKRLEASSILIEPIELLVSQIQLVTSIDGAVILDPQGACYAIGSILDGYATDNGDPSRGARYNSALRYLNSQTDTPCMIVVVSEDRYIDIMTNV